MKRDKNNISVLLKLCQNDALLKKQVDEAFKLSPKESTLAIVRLGRMRGLYFSEHDWTESVKENTNILKKAA